MKTLKKLFFALSLLLLASCDKYYISCHQQLIDRRYLASTHVNTPDPRQTHPPEGQMLVVEWHVPSDVLKKKPMGVVYILLWNYEEKKLTFPIDEKWGYKAYSLLDEEYNKTGGILTYRAEIVLDDHQIYRDWIHQLWVNVIHVNESEEPSVEDQRSTKLFDKRVSEKRTSSSVVDQPMQGSVIDTANFKEEGSSGSN